MVSTFNYNRKSDKKVEEPNALINIPMRLPARLNGAQVAKLLGFSESDIPVLIAAKMLEPLGNPVPNATKYFATCDIEDFAQDSKWLQAATQIIYDFWKGKNARKVNKCASAQKPMAEIALAE